MIMLYADGSAKLIRRRDRYSEMFAPELDVLKMAGPDELEKYHNMYRVNIDKIWQANLKKNGNGNKQAESGSPNKKQSSKEMRDVLKVLGDVQ
jgi:DNA-binding LytR/AlgR family response regulator